MELNGLKSLAVLETAHDLAVEAATQVVVLAREAMEGNRTAQHRRFSIALSGGSTPEAMRRLLAQSPLKAQIDWQHVHIFWGDEHFVPPDHPASTQRTARETLLNHVAIPAANIHAMPTAGLSLAEAARQYEQTIIDFFAPSPPRFDLIFLGMGADGHTASLFPNQVISVSDGRLVTAVFNAPKPPPTRLTLTYNAINQAANVIFLVAGVGKAKAIARAFGDEYDSVRFPTQDVKVGNGRLLWLLDEEAANNYQRIAYFLIKF